MSPLSKLRERLNASLKQTHEEINWLGIEAQFGLDDMLRLATPLSGDASLSQLVATYHQLRGIRRQLKCEEALGHLEARRLEALAALGDRHSDDIGVADYMLITERVFRAPSCREIHRRHQCYDRITATAQRPAG